MGDCGVSCFKKNEKVWVTSQLDGSRFAGVFVSHDGPPLGFSRDGLVAYKIGESVNVIRWPILGLRKRG